jgi:hypothetical protein
MRNSSTHKTHKSSTNTPRKWPKNSSKGSLKCGDSQHQKIHQNNHNTMHCKPKRITHSYKPYQSSGQPTNPRYQVHSILLSSQKFHLCFICSRTYHPSLWLATDRSHIRALNTTLSSSSVRKQVTTNIAPFYSTSEFNFKIINIS